LYCPITDPPLDPHFAPDIASLKRKMLEFPPFFYVDKKGEKKKKDGW